MSMDRLKDEYARKNEELRKEIENSSDLSDCMAVSHEMDKVVVKYAKLALLQYIDMRLGEIADILHRKMITREKASQQIIKLRESFKKLLEGAA